VRSASPSTTPRSLEENDETRFEPTDYAIVLWAAAIVSVVMAPGTGRTSSTTCNSIPTFSSVMASAMSTSKRCTPSSRTATARETPDLKLLGQNALG
ncbi:MAG: hypothetical protein ACHQ1F_02600, partial [Spirochaetia bacterium]